MNEISQVRAAPDYLEITHHTSLRSSCEMGDPTRHLCETLLKLSSETATSKQLTSLTKVIPL